MPTAYECAYYANQFYSCRGGNPLPGWELTDTYYPSFNFNLGVASYYNPGSKDLVVAFRAIENNVDWFSILPYTGGMFILPKGGLICMSV